MEFLHSNVVCHIAKASSFISVNVIDLHPDVLYFFTFQGLSKEAFSSFVLNYNVLHGLNATVLLLKIISTNNRLFVDVGPSAVFSQMVP